MAVRVTKIARDSLSQPPVRGGVGRERRWNRLTVGEAGGEVAVPLLDRGRGVGEFAARGRAVAVGCCGAVPEVANGVAGEANARHAGDQLRDLRERRRLGAAFRQVPPECDVESS
jgi:hypothetical protein